MLYSVSNVPGSDSWDTGIQWLVGELYCTAYTRQQGQKDVTHKLRAHCKKTIVKVGAEGITGLALLIDTRGKVIQFFAIYFVPKGTRSENSRSGSQRHSTGLETGCRVWLEQRVLAENGRRVPTNRGSLICSFSGERSLALPAQRKKEGVWFTTANLCKRWRLCVMPPR